MSFTFRPETRELTRLILGLSGPTKSGKTMSAHRLAVGLANGGQIVKINAEGPNGHLYADRFPCLTADIQPPYRPGRFNEALKAALALKPAVVIIDSASHMHDGPGGLLQFHEEELDRIAGSDYKKRERSTWSAWIKPKAEENEFIYTMLGADCHIILCFRAKEKLKIVKGKDPIDLGWQPIAGDRITFETIFTLTLPPHCKGVPDLGTSEMREPFDTMIPSGKPLDEETGRLLAQWASGSAEGPKAGVAVAEPAPVSTAPGVGEQSSSAENLATEPQRRLIFAKAKEAGVDTASLKAILLEFTGQESSAAIPRDRVEVILMAVESAGVAA
jgi:hypothetical protein